MFELCCDAPNRLERSSACFGNDRATCPHENERTRSCRLPSFTAAPRSPESLKRASRQLLQIDTEITVARAMVETPSSTARARPEWRRGSFCRRGSHSGSPTPKELYGEVAWILLHCPCRSRAIVCMLGREDGEMVMLLPEAWLASMAASSPSRGTASVDRAVRDIWCIGSREQYTDRTARLVTHLCASARR